MSEFLSNTVKHVKVNLIKTTQWCLPVTSDLPVHLQMDTLKLKELSELPLEEQRGAACKTLLSAS